MNVSQRPRRLRGPFAVLMALGGTLVTLAITGTAAMAAIVPPPGGGSSILQPGPSQVAPQTVTVAGGMPGWQITLIALGAALAAAVLAVLAYRAWSARRQPLIAPELARTPARAAGSN
jgi:hypothetical protein